MNIAQQLNASARPLISVEFFPPKTGTGLAGFDLAAQELTGLNPDFVSVTCGAGGSAAGPTLDICRQLDGLGYKSVVPHCTCVGMSRADLEQTSDAIVAQGLTHIMALRGDPPKGQTHFTPAADGFRYASELVAFLKERHPGLCLGVAGYPEKHPEAPSIEEDIRHLKEKVDAGADFITTQLFLDNDVYFDFVARCRAEGITIPILPGLLPVTSLEQINRMRAFCDFHVPEKLKHDLDAAQDRPAKAERIGLYWAIEQISELIEGGAPGIHLYLLNKSRTAFYPELFACLSRVRGQ
ncbi:methylenetetrahydrofolate reductase [NAD(P)H] [Tichowtungia aerotolerans]|uniref:Methylenetetrahydrofolate reductase n=1 Tax=Tichowtungia aerotolerans TaxID=2697043 RepID=A0A6P1M624_9BACT|nr:methylenetetrahydrofolate reductase [NAD(P)H] [Tichowtungia aerotolerans]QHI69482.1 methylenetetrahydrofolate reductase [NAD(P)H] [Tichowtungia aerotolerans]